MADINQNTDRFNTPKPSKNNLGYDLELITNKLWAQLIEEKDTTILDLSQFDFANAVSNETLKVISLKFPRLEVLNLIGCDKIMDEGLKNLKSLPLKELFLLKCDGLSECYRKNFNSQEELLKAGIIEKSKD